MGIFENYGILTLIILFSIVLFIYISIFFWSLKRYEVVITLMLLSPWVHWIFTANEPINPEDIQAGPASYIRVSTVLLLGIIGYFKFFKLKFSSHQISRYQKFPFQLKLFLVFLLFALLSTIYSIDKFYTFVRASEFLAFFGFLLGFYYWLKDKSHLDKALNIYFAVITSGIIINLISLALFPGRVWCWNAPGRFQGVVGHPNTLGAFLMMSYPALMWKYKRSISKDKFLIVLLFSMALFMHIISGSRASLATAVFGFISWHLILNKKGKLLILVGLLFVAGFSFLNWQPKMPGFKRESQSIYDLTGRPEFWHGSLQLIKEKPILGYGYEVAGKIWSDPRFYSPYRNLWIGSPRTSLHNGYLTLTIGLGLVGFFVWLTFVVIPVWRIMFIRVSIYKSLILVIIFQTFLINIFESSISTSRDFTSLVFWFFWAISGRLTNILHLEKRLKISFN